MPSMASREATSRGLGIRDDPAPHSPAKRICGAIIGSYRRECIDHGVPRTYRRGRRYGAVQEMRGALASGDRAGRKPLQAAAVKDVW